MWLAMAGLLLAAQVPADNFVVVDNGRAVATVLLASDCTDVEKLARDELVRFVEKASGVRLQTIDGPMSGQPTIELVSTGAPKPSAEYTILATRDKLRIEGNCPVGLLFGVYDFLERFVGCRWYVSGEIGEVIPRKRSIAVPVGTYRCKPTFYIRSFFFNREQEMWWGLRNRLNGFYSEDFVKSLGSGVGSSLWTEAPRHAFYKLVPPDEFFERHPDYFALIGGKRVPNRQLCTTHPKVIARIARLAREFFAAHPDCLSFSICPNDGYGWCQCERCRALDRAQGGPRKWDAGDRQVMTDRVMWFANRVAERVLRDFPDRELFVYAYVNYSPPPAVEWPRPGVVAWLCHYWPACYAHPIRDKSCPENRKFYGYLRRWTERVRDQMGFYAYTDKSMWEGLPRPVVHQMADDIKLLAELGVRRYVAQSSARNWGQMEALYWITAKLLWDASADVEKLRDDWYSGFFGSAGPAMRAYYDVLYAAVRDGGHHFSCHPAREGPLVFPEQVIAQAAGYLRRAEQAAESEIVCQRIAVIAQAFDLGAKRLEYYRCLDRFNQTADKNALKRAVELGRELLKHGGLFARRNRKRIGELLQLAEGGLIWSGFGDLMTLGGRKCRNSDETGPGDAAAGWATFQFVVPDFKTNHRLIVLVWGKSSSFSPVICSAGAGASKAQGGKWTPLKRISGQLSGKAQWDQLVFEIPAKLLDSSRRLQIIGFGGGDSQIWVAEARIEPVSKEGEER